ncbi:MAG: hemerythrin domain-containing protein [Thermoleophilia bacterium]
MDLLKEIFKDHEEFRAQLATMLKIATSDPDESVKIFRSFFDHLVAHHETEEHIFFPKLKAYEDATDSVEEALEEHKAIDLYLEWVKASHKTERWEAKVSVLKELVTHHLAEEEDKVFKAARSHLKDELASLGEKFEAEEQKRLSK